MIIQPATEKDLDRIHQITLHSFGPYCAVQAIKERYDIGRGVEDKARSVRGFCEHNLNRVVVLRKGGRWWVILVFPISKSVGV